MNAVAFTVLVAVLVTFTASGLPDCVIYPKLLELNVNLFARAIYLFTLILSKNPKSSVVGLKSEQVNNTPRSRIYGIIDTSMTRSPNDSTIVDGTTVDNTPARESLLVTVVLVV